MRSSLLLAEVRRLQSAGLLRKRLNAADIADWVYGQTALSNAAVTPATVAAAMRHFA